MTSPAESSAHVPRHSPNPDRDSSAARTPNGRIYWDPEILQTELDRFFYRNWVNVGREEAIPESGDFFTRQVGRESILFVRGPDKVIRGFYNLCRHRGTQVVLAADGKGAHSFICPYHSWAYDLSGRLVGALHMKEQADFDRADYGLHPVRVEMWGGFIWANLEPTGPDLRASLGPFLERFERFPIADLRLGAKMSYEVEANWKVLVENFSECYHCAPVHPSLNRLTPYLSGENDARFSDQGTRSLFSGGFMEFAQDFQSMTRTGYTNRPLVPGMTAADKKRVYYYVVFPNLFFSLHPDYLMIHRSWPVTPSHSRVENEFYFTQEAMAAPGFDPSDAAGLWDEINKQDWTVCQLAQQGMGSRAWSGGRYSDQEELVRDFDRFIVGELATARRADGHDARSA
ncbi:MAG: aromatic ring-hydroxylating dioxygenase subunit alpha, partial [Candidatus Lutacidiplasmatales archaeon]